MYTNAKKILGLWTILLKSDENNPRAVPQFRSLSRKMANEWAAVNTPLPAAHILNATVDRAVWRARG